MISTVPQPRPPAGHERATAVVMSHGSTRPTSACHWMRPRSRSAVASPAITGSQVSPPVRSDRLVESSSPDERSTLPDTASTRPADVITTRGSTISRPSCRATSFSISHPARVHCQTSPCGTTSAPALIAPASSRPGVANTGMIAASRGCHFARSPTSDPTALVAVELAAGRIQATVASAGNPATAARSTTAPPSSDASSRSSPDASTMRPRSIAAPPDTMLPSASASTESCLSCQVGLPGTAISTSARLAASESDPGPVPAAATSSRP